MSKQTSFLFFLILIISTIPLPQANALGIGPPLFELDLPINGSNSTKFYITSDGLSGELIVGMEELPFRVEPSRINITSSDVNMPVELTFYGNETLEPSVYEGKVTFLAYTGGFVAVGIKIRAKINLYELVPAQPGMVKLVSGPESSYEPGVGDSIELEYIVDFVGSDREYAECEVNITYPSGAVYDGYTAEVGDEDLEMDVRPISGVPGVTLASENIPFGRLTLSVMLSAPDDGGDYQSNTSYWFSISNKTAIVDSENGEYVILINIDAEPEPEAESESESEAEPDIELQEMNYTPYMIGVAAILALVLVVIWWKRR